MSQYPSYDQTYAAPQSRAPMAQQMPYQSQSRPQARPQDQYGYQRGPPTPGRQPPPQQYMGQPKAQQRMPPVDQYANQRPIMPSPNHSQPAPQGYLPQQSRPAQGYYQGQQSMQPGVRSPTVQQPQYRQPNPYPESYEKPVPHSLPGPPPAGVNSRPPQRRAPYGEMGYNGSNSDLANGFNGMSINGNPPPSRNPQKMPPSNIGPSMPGYANVPPRPASPSQYRQGQGPGQGQGMYGRQSPVNPRPPYNSMNGPAGMSGGKGRNQVPSPINSQLTSDGRSSHDQRSPEATAGLPVKSGNIYGTGDGYAVGDYNRASPTAITDDQANDYGASSPVAGAGEVARISTNRIPPSSTVANPVVSPMAAEYQNQQQRRAISPPYNAAHAAMPLSYNDDSRYSTNRRSQNSAESFHSDNLRPMQSDPSLQQYPKTQSPPLQRIQSHPQQQQQQQQEQQQQQLQRQQHQTVDQKPPPRRQYSSANNADSLDDIPENQKLHVFTIEEFERKRQAARNKSHDSNVQLEFAKKLVEASQNLASKYSDPNTPARTNNHVDAKTERKNREAWIYQAYKIVKKLSNSGHANSIFYLASNYSSGGLGLETDHDKAYELYHKAAKLDQAEAAYRVAVCNEIGAGARKDTQKALLWYKKAAQIGDISAMYKLGMISLNGLLGQPRSFAEAVTWLERAAEKADSETPHAVHELGLLYERIDNVDMSAVNQSGTATVIQRDERKAFELFIKAAKLGYPPSQFRLGCAYEYGTLGCSVDPKRSIAWYSRAAEKGEPESELALSGWYLTGSEGVLQQSDTEAYLWARKAAEKGLPKAEYALGYFSEVGIGVKADMEEARKWYFKAAAQKHPKAVSRLQELRNESNVR